MNRIAAILTCHNRCDKTLVSLKSLVDSLNNYNNENNEQLHVEIFLTDDGCTDCTVSEVNKCFASIIPVHIIQGDGNRFWAGGMRDAWSEAQKQEWDYFLLLNDDTAVKDNVFSELLNTHIFCLEQYGKVGIYSGITCTPGDETQITYGGDVWTNKFLCKTNRLPPAGYPQMCDMTNANILLVPQSVVYNIGIFNDKYAHSFADYDYSMEARAHDIPVLITANVCGECENDHPDADVVEKVCKMSLTERRHFVKNPLHSSSDYLYFVRKFTPFRYPIAWVGRNLLVYMPRFYKILYNIRLNN